MYEVFCEGFTPTSDAANPLIASDPSPCETLIAIILWKATVPASSWAAGAVTSYRVAKLSLGRLLLHHLIRNKGVERLGSETRSAMLVGDFFRKGRRDEGDTMEAGNTSKDSRWDPQFSRADRVVDRGCGSSESSSTSKHNPHHVPA